MTTSIEPPSLQSTPGLEIPGAFPREQHTRQHPLSDSHRATDTQQPISLPSSEKEGTHPGEHCGGVGPLPGSISETSVAKLPDERTNEVKTAPGPSSRTKEVFPEGDDPREAVAAAVAPASTAAAKVPESEAAPESALKSKELAADTDREDVAAPAPAAAAGAASSVTAAQESPVQKADTQAQGSPDAIGKQVPAEEQRAETSGPAEGTTPADSKFKEELKKEELRKEKSRGEGVREPPPAQVTPVQDLAMPKGTEEDPKKAAPVQQQQQQQQPVGGQAPATRKGRSSSDSDASNHVKASIMNRVKGEMKVLLGKASGNKEKVEEGERMKQGTQ